MTRLFLKKNELPIVLANTSLDKYRDQFDPHMRSYNTRPHLIACIEGHMQRLVRRLPSRWAIGLYQARETCREREYRNPNPDAHKEMGDEQVVELVSDAQIALGLALLPFDEIDSRIREYHNDQMGHLNHERQARIVAHEAFYDAGYEVRVDGKNLVITGPGDIPGERGILAIFMRGEWSWSR